MTLKQKAMPTEVTITRNKYKLNHFLFLAFMLIILMMQTLFYHYNYIITNNVIKTAMVKLKVIVKFALEQAMRDHRGSIGITLLLLEP